MIAAKDAGIILGFIDLIKSSIEGLFVGLAYRKKGRGKALIDAVKNEGSALTVAAFSKKMGVIWVYQREEFVLLRRKKNCGTGKESLIFFFMRKKDVGDA
ncbi:MULTISPECIES: GNAT family N-acetyltransferase [Acidaminococcus]|jgi:putative acetyltransferase|nr:MULTISPECIES: GNAT family N-acetyltransferase [Acidaminococcus]